jgi:hypothetical protein
MTQKAREVLKDCHKALSFMESETDYETWKIFWAGAIALIRAVGHVLDKIDGQDPLVKAAAKEAFYNWKIDEKHSIFRDFIEKERNNLLKEYASGVHPFQEVPIVIDLTLASLGKNEQKQLISLKDVIEFDENIYRPMLEGPWAGDDCRDVYKEALTWWENELDSIDEKIKLKKTSSP